MTQSAFERHAAYATTNGTSNHVYTLETTAFDSRVQSRKAESDIDTVRTTLTVRVPSLDTAVEESVGPNLLDGWFDTFERRLEDAPGAVRETVTFDECTAQLTNGEVIVTLSFSVPDDWAARAPDIAKALAEYVEGTYAEGIVPGYTYSPPVSELLASARNDGSEHGGPMPL